MNKELLHRLQYAFVKERYNNGIFYAQTLDEADVNNVISEFIKWLLEKDLLNGLSISVEELSNIIFSKESEV